MPFDQPSRGASWHASLALAVERRAGRSVLARRAHDGPLVVQKALYPEGDEVCHAIVVHPPGGIAGGDQLRIALAAGAQSHTLVTTPGAAKWYRSVGAAALQHVAIDAAEGSVVEWLPQESIVYDGAVAGMRWHANLARGARLVAWDIVCLGRIGSGERFTRGRCSLDMRLSRDGVPVLVEKGAIDMSSLASPVALGGHAVFATFLAACGEATLAQLAGLRELRPAGGESAVTRVPGALIARYRGDSTLEAREYCVGLWKALREPVLGRAAVEPRIWRT